MNDELHDRLRRQAPDTEASIHPVDGPRAAALLEQIMNTPITPDAPTASRPSRSRRLYVLAGGVAAAAIAVGAFALTRDDDAGSTKSATQVTFTMPEAAGGPASSMCIRVDAYQPTAGQPAFEGTVLSVGDGTVTLQVHKWFSGGDADQVVLTTPGNGQPDPVLEGGVAFAVGSEYLVMALDGQVVGCGVSDVASPELEALYEQWFPG